MAIFVSIASYRDPQLAPTLQDCLAKALYPDQLRIGVCWQHGDDEPPPEIFGDPRLQVLDVDWRHGHGACRARARLMDLWGGEDWFLQLDSHHRFVHGWDQVLMDQAAATGSEKPLLTTYAHPFDPGDERSLGREPMRMEFDRFTQDGIALCRPGPIPVPTGGPPVRSRFLSAHFFFAPGSLVDEVPYDPDLSSLGEETTLAIRAFTHGYDLFHPSVPVVWHQYSGQGGLDNRGDHRHGGGVPVDGGLHDVPGRKRVRDFLDGRLVGRFGCGTERTFAEYERYAGLSFRHRRVRDYTRAHGEPPGPADRPDWVERTRDRSVRMVIDADRLPPGALDGVLFWCVTVHDVRGDEILRADAGAAEVAALAEVGAGQVVLERTFESTATPATWKVTPVSRDEAWLEPLVGRCDGPESVPSPAGRAAPTPAEVPGSVTPPAPPGATPASPPGVPPATPSEWLDELDRRPLATGGVVFTQTSGGFAVTRHGEEADGYTLNSTGVLLLELANGRYTLAEIIAVVRDQYGLDGSAEGLIRDFYRRAAEQGLLREAVEPRNGHAGPGT